MLIFDACQPAKSGLHLPRLITAPPITACQRPLKEFAPRTSVEIDANCELTDSNIPLCGSDQNRRVSTAHSLSHSWASEVGDWAQNLMTISKDAREVFCLPLSLAVIGLLFHLMRAQ